MSSSPSGSLWSAFLVLMLLFSWLLLLHSWLDLEQHWPGLSREEQEEILLTTLSCWLTRVRLAIDESCEEQSLNSWLNNRISHRGYADNDARESRSVSDTTMSSFCFISQMLTQSVDDDSCCHRHIETINPGMNTWAGGDEYSLLDNVEYIWWYSWSLTAQQ